MYRIILASESPRRKEIMDKMGISYMALASSIEERVSEKEPGAMVQALAALKAEDIAFRMKDKYENRIIIGADTMVFFQKNALGKPKDEADAVRMLQMLSGNEHEVYTGVSIIISNEKKESENIKFSVCTKVAVQPMTKVQIADYAAGGEPMDKAGAYAIQGQFGIYIKEIAGDYYNVVGFPIAKIYEVLLSHGIDIKSKINIA
jgi:septum formation protein